MNGEASTLEEKLAEAKFEADRLEAELIKAQQKITAAGLDRPAHPLRVGGIQVMTKEFEDYLKNTGYVEVQGYSLSDSKLNAWWLIRPEENEGNEHALLKYLIFEEVRHYTKDAYMSPTRTADVEFTAKNAAKNGNRVGVEVLTDVFLKDPKKLKEKINAMKKNYDELFIVATNYKLIRHYNKLKLGVKILKRSEVLGEIKAYF